MNDEKKPKQTLIVEGPLPEGSPAAFVEAIDAHFKGGSQNLSELPDSPGKEQIQRQADTLTRGIEAFCNPYFFPHPRINALMRDVWSICNSQIVRAGMIPGNPVKTLSFIATKRAGEWFAMIVVPQNFEQQAEQDTFNTAGAVLFVGSQVRDYYNGKYEDDPQACLRRAKMWEAEYVLMVQKADPSITLNNYQKEIVAMFPQGLASEPSLLYEPIKTPDANHGQNPQN